MAADGGRRLMTAAERGLSTGSVRGDQPRRRMGFVWNCRFTGNRPKGGFWERRSAGGPRLI